MSLTKYVKSTNRRFFYIQCFAFENQKQTIKKKLYRDKYSKTKRYYIVERLFIVVSKQNYRCCSRIQLYFDY